MADREQVVDDLEALVPRGEIDGGDVADLRELGGGVVYREREADVSKESRRYRQTSSSNWGMTTYT